MTDAPLPNLMDLTPLNEGYRTDPYAALADLRERCPVHRDEMSASYILTRYADVRALVSDRSLWRDPLKADDAHRMIRAIIPAELEGLPRGETTSILMLDNPDHERIRGPLTKAFYARVAKFRPEVERIVDDTLDAIPTDAPFDLMSRFCVPVPIDVIASILGVDRELLGQFREWSENVIQAVNPFRTPEQTAVMEQASQALAAYFTETIAARRAAPRDDLISDMTRLQADGAPLSDAELRINLSGLLIGGNLTTTDLIGNAVRLLLLHPDQLAKLKADPGIVSAVVEETLRYEPPVDMHRRVASRDLEVAGCPVKATQSLTFSLRAANRDPEAFDGPGPVRREPRTQAARGVRRRRPHLHRRAPGPAGGAGGAAEAVRAVS